MEHEIPLAVTVVTFAFALGLLTFTQLLVVSVIVGAADIAFNCSARWGSHPGSTASRSECPASAASSAHG